jgi:hypothetical protein
MPHRLDHVELDELTLLNYKEFLPPELAEQVTLFLPPSGSFDLEILKRYIKNIRSFEKEDPFSNLSLANRLRLVFRSMEPDTICSKFPKADLTLKRRLRCVAEYLIRSGEFKKLTDANNKLVKKIGAMGKPVVIYVPTEKMLRILEKQGLLKLKDE